MDDSPEDDFLAHAQRKAKQQYLIEEVMQQGYSPEEFISYCRDEKSSDIDEWGFDELQDWVSGFKFSIQNPKRHQRRSTGGVPKKYSKANRISGNYSDDEIQQAPVVLDSVESEGEDLPELWMNQSVLPKMPSTPNRHSMGFEFGFSPPTVQVGYKAIEDTAKANPILFENSEGEVSGQKDKLFDSVVDVTYIHETQEPPPSIIPCKSLPETDLSKVVLPMQVVIREMFKIPKGVFSKSYTQFLVETEPLDWKVRRRYSEFVWLRDQLESQYPGYCIPPLSGPRAGRVVDHNFVHRRVTACVRFLNECLESPFLRCTPELDVFLRDAKGLSRVRKPKSSKPVALSEVYSQTGEITLDLKRNSKMYENFEDDLGMLEVLKKRLKFHSSTLQSCLEKMTSVLQDMSKTFAQMEHFQSIVSNNDEIRGLYKEVGGACRRWSCHTRDQSKIVDTHLARFFKYGKREIPALRKLLKERNMHLSKLKQMEENLNQRKEVLFKEKTTEKWDIPVDVELSTLADRATAFQYMLPRETEIVKQQEKLFGYFNSQTQSEFRRIGNGLHSSELEHYKKLFSEMTCFSDKMHQNWMDMEQQLLGGAPEIVEPEVIETHSDEQPSEIPEDF